MTYNWYDTRASTWYKGYGPEAGPTSGNDGNFVDITTLSGAEKDSALNSLTNNVVAMLERQGVATKDVASTQEYKAAMEQIEAGNTKEALQGVAGSTTSAWHRDDLWGADASEGGDAMRGRSFLESENLADTTTIKDLYTQGFGKKESEIDAEGLKYWEDRLAGTGGHGEAMTIQQIAKSFAQSDEAYLRDVYHEQFGRDADQTGIDYWLSSNDEKVTGISDRENLEKVITYRGEDQDGDGFVSNEERLTSKYHVSAETMVRDDFRDDLGLTSRTDDRASNPFFTAANNADVQKHVDYIRSSRTDDMVNDYGVREAGVGRKDDAYDDSLFSATHIDYQALTQDALNQGDRDDKGDQATLMGRFATKEEMKEYMDNQVLGDSGDFEATQESKRLSRDPNYTRQYGEDVYSDVMGKTWGALTDENVKTLDDYVPWNITKPGGHLMDKEEAEKLLVDQGNIDHWKKHSSIWLPSQTKDKDTGPIGEDGWRIKPEPRPRLPTPLPVGRDDINYMPKLTSDVKDTSKYATAKGAYDTDVKASAPTTTKDGKPLTAAPQNVVQRITDTSAKGVRMKRSKASRMGTIRGTKQLGREQQLKSLNTV